MPKIELPPEARRGFTVDEVAASYHISRQTVYNLINTGRLGSFKIGQRRIVTAKHLDDWESGQSVGGAA